MSQNRSSSGSSNANKSASNRSGSGNTIAHSTTSTSAGRFPSTGSPASGTYYWDQAKHICYLHKKGHTNAQCHHSVEVASPRGGSGGGRGGGAHNLSRGRGTVEFGGARGGGRGGRGGSLASTNNSLSQSRSFGTASPSAVPEE